jgi:thioesterase domain-containing protein/NAD(P)-dependent dehydrogenase (short-subunit alcohol dehydrogenase family)
VATHPATERNAGVIRAVRAMEEAGAEVMVRAAHAAVPGALANVIAEARERWGRLDGVIHAAGTSGNDRIAFLKPDSEVRNVLAPKVEGLATLVQCLGKEPLDFVALLSSINSIVGGPGLCDYASANAVLDIFPDAAHRPAAWRRVVVVSFSAWRDVGMATRVSVAPDRRQAWDEMMRTAITPGSGTEAFLRSLASGRQRLLVTPYDIVEGLARLRGVAPAAPREEIRPDVQPAAAPVEAPGPSQDRPALANPYEAPSTATEKRLAAIWSELLGVGRVGVNDDWFQLGGHSLLATRLFSRIEQVTGRNLPLAALLDDATIRHLASLVGETEPEPEPVPEPVPEKPVAKASGQERAEEPLEQRSFARLVPIRRQGQLTPFFCVHGAGGNVLNLQDLARHVSHERPFYAFQARGLDGTTDPHQTIEAMAEEYLGELRTLQPKGPYFLGGYCGGGLVAYEMAQLLREAGEEVAFLGLIDFPRPGSGQRARAHRWMDTIRTADVRLMLVKLRAKVSRDFVSSSSQLRIRLLTAFGRRVPHELRGPWLMESYRLAQDRYRLKPFDGRLTVFRARDGGFYLQEEPGFELGWGGLAGAGVDVRLIPGDHDSLMLEPNVRMLGEQLEDAIAQAEHPQLERAV